MRIRCLLLFALTAMVLPNTVRACTNGETLKPMTLAQDVKERLSKSEYIVEKGGLTQRPGGVVGVSTNLNHDEEFKVMKKGFEAAKAKLTIPDGVGVILDEGKDYYEVIVGSATTPNGGGVDYAAKAMVDKKSLEVVWVEMNDPKVLDEQTAKKVAEFRELSERLTKSEYVVEKGELTRRPNSATGTSTPLSHDDEFKVMKKSLDAVKGKLSIADGSGVIITEEEKFYEIIIGTPLPAGTRGPDYTAKVMVDKKNLNVVQILAGG